MTNVEDLQHYSINQSKAKKPAGDFGNSFIVFLSNKISNKGLPLYCFPIDVYLFSQLCHSL